MGSLIWLLLLGVVATLAARRLFGSGKKASRAQTELEQLLTFREEGFTVTLNPAIRKRGRFTERYLKITVHNTSPPGQAPIGAVVHYRKMDGEFKIDSGTFGCSGVGPNEKSYKLHELLGNTAKPSEAPLFKLDALSVECAGKVIKRFEVPARVNTFKGSQIG